MPHKNHFFDLVKADFGGGSEADSSKQGGVAISEATGVGYTGSDFGTSFGDVQRER